MTPLAHATAIEREHYAAWLLALAKKTRGRMAEHLRRCADAARESFYA